MPKHPNSCLKLGQPGSPQAQPCYDQRVAAGLTLAQAAKALGIEPRHLADVEHGRMPLRPELAARMSEVYGVGS